MIKLNTSWLVPILILVFGQLLIHENSFASSKGKPLALVYNGPGTCLSCWVSASQVARMAGFKVQHVNAKFKNFELLKKAKIWVQPGGHSKTAAAAMGPEYLEHIRQYVFDGGAYVGFCAGAFLSTAKIGTTDTDGLGIIPGRTELWDENDARQITTLNWNGVDRQVLYAGGPYIDLMNTKDPDVHAFAFYPDGRINAVTNIYGSGKVAVTGTHPEARKFWKFMDGLLGKDKDGSDQFLAVQMIQWATSN